MLKIELEYMEAVKAIAREMRKQSSESQIWDQRLYEVARELFVKSVTAGHNSIEIGGAAKVAIQQAETFIKILRETQDHGQKGK